MSKKQLNVAGIKNELTGASLFFAKRRPDPEIRPTPPETPPEGRKMPEVALKMETGPSVPSRQIEAEKKPPIAADSSTAGLQASKLASDQDNVIEQLRKTVKALGKEVAFTRITPEEKARLADIVYTYKRQGIKTSENEINRIAINYLIQDYEAHGQNSLLAKVLAALNA